MRKQFTQDLLTGVMAALAGTAALALLVMKLGAVHRSGRGVATPYCGAIRRRRFCSLLV
jgi:hypothetical protein